MKNFIIKPLLGIILSAVLIGSCQQSKKEDPKPVVKNSNIPVRMTTESTPSIPGVTTGYTTVKIIFESGYTYQLVFTGDPTSGYTGINVISPGGTYVVDYDEIDGEISGPCLAQALQFVQSWTSNFQNLYFEEDPCPILNDYFNDLEDLIDCLPVENQEDLSYVKDAIEEWREDSECE
jgi:hypothetical protein